jgi:hypothetical protein
MFRLASIGQGVLKRNLDGIGTSDAMEIDKSGKNFLADTAWGLLSQPRH